MKKFEFLPFAGFEKIRIFMRDKASKPLYAEKHMICQNSLARTFSVTVIRKKIGEIQQAKFQKLNDF